MKLFAAKQLAILVSAATICSSPASAIYTCFGTVDQLELTPGGAVVLHMSGPASANMVVDPTLLSPTSLSAQIVCNLVSVSSDPSPAVQPAVCKVIYQTFLAAKLSGKRIGLWFNESATGGVTASNKCTSVAHPAYTTLTGTGWYFGPTLVD
jgi:hypothetical protein